MGTLYVIATPIGNLEDITLRALRVFREVGLVAAEDTRTTRKLLTHFSIQVSLISYNQHNARQRIPRILQALSQSSVALVSDAGVPLISDPGHELVREASRQGFRAVPVPGPSAITAALAVAGLPADSFHFLGFLSRVRKHRISALRAVAPLWQTLVAFEVPHRIRTSLDDILATLGDRQLAVCREMTKVYEEVFHGCISEAITHFQQPRGEFVLIISGASTSMGKDERAWDAIRQELVTLKVAGCTRRDAVAQVTATYGISRRDAYHLWMEALKG